LGKKLTDLGLKEHPAQIFNCDESGLSTNPGMSRIITKREMKNPVQVIPGSGKEQITILALASASGVHYPPFVVCWKKFIQHLDGRWAIRSTLWNLRKWMDGYEFVLKLV